MLLKPQDFLVALKLAAWGGQRWTYALLAQELDLSASEVHSAVKRGLQAKLLAQNYSALPATLATDIPAVLDAVDPDNAMSYKTVKQRRPSTYASAVQLGSDNPVMVHSQNLAEFAVHGAKYVFIAERTFSTIGVPTSHSAPAFAGVFAPGSADFVWPHPNGVMRGAGVSPLHSCVPFAAMRDPKLYEMLALFDALRVGRARERGMALKRLPQIIHPSQSQILKDDAHG